MPIKYNLIDLVIGGPDFSGTSTQIKWVTEYFQKKGLKIRDLGGTEQDLLFHAEIFKDINQNHISMKSFLDDENISKEQKDFLLFETYSLLSGYKKHHDLQVGSFVKTNKTTYINPDSADVFVQEEPTRRGSGQVNRVIEQNRADFGRTLNPYSAALSHQNYRTDEFLRIRLPLREAKKIQIRSRSEESACYQIKDKKRLPNGINEYEYLKLPGHIHAFGIPPTHIWLVHGPANWTLEEYKKFKSERSKERTILDGHEVLLEYQLLVNKRYATSWIDRLYKKACKMHCSLMPEITKFNALDEIEVNKAKMYAKLDEIMMQYKKPE